MNVFMVPSELTIIKSKKDAEAVLNLLEGNKVLQFKAGENKDLNIIRYVAFSRVNQTKWEYYQGIEGEDNTFNPAMIIRKNEAVENLYKYRKYYNAMWRD